MAIAEMLSRVAAELALFAGVGFLLFAINDVLVDLIYFARAIWRSLAIYTRYPRAFASGLPQSGEPGFIALLVPAPKPTASTIFMTRWWLLNCGRSAQPRPSSSTTQRTSFIRSSFESSIG
jgi:hypothetical protein